MNLNQTQDINQVHKSQEVPENYKSHKLPTPRFHKTVTISGNFRLDHSFICKQSFTHDSVSTP